MATPTTSQNTSAGTGIDPISAAVGAAATIANTIAGISDMNKRRTIEANLSYLSEKEQIALAKEIARKNNKNDQAALLINTVMAARNAAAEREQRTQTVKWVLIGSLGLGTLFIIAWYLKK